MSATRPSTIASGDDESVMRRALELARRGEGFVEPNPMVGCVLVRDGEIIGEGFHQRFGGPHAEIEALSSLTSPNDAEGATAYVTLEPCCHHGKTPPCSKALIDAKVGRVVVAVQDPFPRVDGGGLKQLDQAGIQTAVGALQQEAETLNAPYFKRIRTGRPWVIAKWAMTIDGRIATAAHDSQWITGDASRGEAHRLRGRVDAIVVGMGTVIDDDPTLTARLADHQKPPRTAKRIVFCRHRMPGESSKLVQSARDVPLCLVVASEIDQSKLERLAQMGAEIVPTHTNEPAEMVAAALDWMGSQSMTNVMIEGGSELLASFFECDQIDECHVYVGAKAVGGRGAPGPIGGVGVEKINQACEFDLISADKLNHDLRAVYRRNRR